MASLGFIDLHSHLLPGIDDGCASYDQALNCIRQLHAAGFVGSVCTPHMRRDEYPDNTPANVAVAVEQLAQRVADAGLEYRLWPGGEVRIASTTVADFEAHGVPTLGSGRAVLIDHWGAFWPPDGDAVCEYLLARGFQVILAHPERMEFLLEDIEQLVQRLVGWGVLLQGNLNSVAGREGVRAAAFAERYLDRQQYWVLASDTHHPAGLPGRLAGLAAVMEQRGQQAAELLLAIRPAALLTSG